MQLVSLSKKIILSTLIVSFINLLHVFKIFMTRKFLLALLNAAEKRVLFPSNFAKICFESSSGEEGVTALGYFDIHK